MCVIVTKKTNKYMSKQVMNI